MRHGRWDESARQRRSPPSIKGLLCKSGGCVVKVEELNLGGLACVWLE